jgi:P-loop containing NTP hydrolase pore-1
MVMLDYINDLPPATQAFVIRLADEGHPIAAAIIGFPLEETQAPPTLTETDETYLYATVEILRSQNRLRSEAEALVLSIPRRYIHLEAPATIPPPAQPQPQPSIGSMSTAAAALPQTMPAPETTQQYSSTPAASAAPRGDEASSGIALLSRLAAELPTESLSQLQQALRQYYTSDRHYGPLIMAAAAVLHLPERRSLLDAFKSWCPRALWSALDVQVERARAAAAQRGGGESSFVGHGTRPSLSTAPTRMAGPNLHPITAAGGAGSSRLGPMAAPASRPVPPPANQQQAEEDDGNVDDEAEDAANTYSSYVAKNIRELFPNVSAHPDPLVETASLASVQLPNLDESIRSQYEDLQEDIALGRLSDAQMESIIYAWIKFQGPRLPDGKRRGFFLGDGAGVGKGRTIAGLVKQHWNAGGKYILWVSVSQDLRRDARRDLDDIGASGIGIYQPKGTKHIPEVDYKGVVFITYSLLRAGLPSAIKRKRRKKRAAAAAAGGAGRSRVARLLAMEAAEGILSGGSTSGSEFGGDDDDDNVEEEEEEEPLSFEIT